MHRPVAEGDAVAEAVLARRTPKLPVHPDVLAFGVGVEAKWLHIDADRKGRGSPLDTCPVVRQAIILPVDHRAWLQSCIYDKDQTNRKSSFFLHLLMYKPATGHVISWPTRVQNPLWFLKSLFWE